VLRPTFPGGNSDDAALSPRVCESFRCLRSTETAPRTTCAKYFSKTPMLAALPSFGIQFVEEKSEAIQDFCFHVRKLVFSF